MEVAGLTAVVRGAEERRRGDHKPGAAVIWADAAMLKCAAAVATGDAVLPRRKLADAAKYPSPTAAHFSLQQM
jgi:hypothetical protein